MLPVIPESHDEMTETSNEQGVRTIAPRAAPPARPTTPPPARPTTPPPAWPTTPPPVWPTMPPPAAAPVAVLAAAPVAVPAAAPVAVPAAAPVAVPSATPVPAPAELGETTPRRTNLDEVIRSFLDRLDLQDTRTAERINAIVDAQKASQNQIEQLKSSVARAGRQLSDDETIPPKQLLSWKDR
ncbi:unnamed protein product [Arabidopsis thaliana]|uniref:Uncharacterized protein n=1 Tax=Arabidopsis thaliana TaxID=3702 RepID=A0A654G410_ARATH|nr:unnamed protein product [Arabidopsis thaliana]